MAEDWPQPPVAAKRPRELSAHGETRIDEYYWLRDDDRGDPDVLQYLRAENAYADVCSTALAPCVRRCFTSSRPAYPNESPGFPYRLGDWYYLWRYEADHEHPVYLRRHGAEDAADEVILDVNVLAREHEFFTVDGLTISEDGRLLAYGEDDLSREIYTLRVRDLDNRRMAAGSHRWHCRRCTPGPTTTARCSTSPRTP